MARKNPGDMARLSLLRKLDQRSIIRAVCVDFEVKEREKKIWRR